MKTNHLQKPAVFLDRDGTICEEVGYLNTVEDLKLIPGAAEAIQQINRAGWRTVILSNQSGVARGLLSENTVKTINDALIQKLINRNAKIDGIYYCPHHPEGNPPYNTHCDCRKPASGMLLTAEKNLNIDIHRSVVIGDKFTDVLTAQRLNIPGILLLTGYGKDELHRYQKIWRFPPTHIANNLWEAIEWWFSNLGKNRG